MLQIPISPRKRRSLLGNPSLGGMSMDTGLSAGSRQHASYLGLPAKYSGIPNFMQYRIGAGSELQGADLSRADLRWSNFRGANLRSANLSASILWGSTMANAQLANADLTQADLTGVDLVGADLTDALTEGASFLGARYDKTTRFPEDFGNPEEKGMILHADSCQMTDF